MQLIGWPDAAADGVDRGAGLGVLDDLSATEQGVPGRGRVADAARDEGVAEPRGRDQVRVRISRNFDARRENVRRDLGRVGREVFGEGFNFELAESITTSEGEQAQGAFDPAARMAYIALRTDEPGMQASLMHEGLHFLRNGGAFSGRGGADTAAWKTLEREAVARRGGRTTASRRGTGRHRRAWTPPSASG